MARIAGVDLPRNKRIEIALTYIFGIGRPTANAILGKASINRDTRTQDLAETDVVASRPKRPIVPTARLSQHSMPAGIATSTPSYLNS